MEHVIDVCVTETMTEFTMEASGYQHKNGHIKTHRGIDKNLSSARLRISFNYG